MIREASWAWHGFNCEYCHIKILQKRINFPTFVGGGRGSRTTKKFPSILFPTFVGGGGGKTGKELFPPYELFF